MRPEPLHIYISARLLGILTISALPSDGHVVGCSQPTSHCGSSAASPEPGGMGSGYTTPIRGSSFRAATKPGREGNAAMSIVLDYLRGIAPHFRSHARPPGLSHAAPQEYVLDHGHEFVSTSLTAFERGIVHDALDGVADPQPNHCYRNAQAIVLADETATLTYYEGFAADDVGLVAAHAWASIHGKVIDVTWRHRGRPVFGVFPEGFEYVGAEIDRAYLVARRAESVEVWSLLVDDHFEFERYLLRP